MDSLCEVLEAAKIPYWRDRKDLGPGDAWRAKIREAIRSGSLVFLACFSDNSRAKGKSYMNEELTLAVEEFRQMPPGRTWIIPTRFDGGDLPYWDLGAGRSLDDYNYVDLFGKAHAAEAAKLVTTIHGLMGDRQMSPAAALEAVEQATTGNRVELLKQLTKDMLVDPAKRIQLDDLVSQEVQRILKVINDDERVAGPVSGNGEERIVKYATAAQEMWDLVKPFCASLQVAARYGTPDVLAPWVTGIRSLVQAAMKTRSGDSGLLDLGALPGMISLMTAGLAGVSARRYDNVKALVADPMVRSKYDSKPLPVLVAVDPFSPFDNQEWTANALARGAIEDRPFAEALADMTENRVGKYRTPVGEWLHFALRPIFADQWPDEDAFASEFDRAEVFLGILGQDAVNARAAANPEARGWGRSHWFGRSTWRAGHGHGNAVEDVQHELATEGELWGPLRDNLFGGEASRAKTAADGYQENFDRMAGRFAL
ncbi:toll/interleukin-1 receptor domain-containing protein [Nocardioides campestrisoli]|uniref:toll/interleukin-1 receptor domain-containing protein n=1 Tax=Nocardioides campestrisoli TaxID=2736757 RepID=UPI00281274CB|nr:toll/interleukin-1 receptor domain-containing protein [Nocardioides campestrisoli]